MIALLLDVVRFILGAAALLVLLYVPGAVALNALAARRPAPHLFSGVEEWLFSALLISVLATGGVGFVLAEVGWFSWWTVLLVTLAVSAVLGRVGTYGVGADSWGSSFREFGPSSDRTRLGGLFNLLKVHGSYPQRATDRRQASQQRIALLVILVVAAALFSRPAEMLRGALDSGVYINGGVALGRTGSIFQHDILMRQLNDNAGEGRELLQGLNRDRYVLDRLRMPGFYVYDKQAAVVAPQHYFLYPTWIGLLYGLFGIWGALYATPLLALLAVIAVYFFARRALSPGAALVALALLALCPVTIWFARYPVSEVITGLLAFAGFYAFMRMVQLSQERDLPATFDEEANHDVLHAESARRAWASLWGVVAGLSLGELALARPDFIFYFAPLPFYLIYWRLSRSWRRPYTWFASTLAAMLGLYLMYYFIYGYPYTLDLYHNTIINIRRLWQPLLIVLYLGSLLLLALDRLYPRVRPLWKRLASLTVRYRWVWAGALMLLVGVFALYRYGIDPWLRYVRFDKDGNALARLYQTTMESYIGAPVDEGSQYNMLRIGWYLSPPGMALGVIGLLRWIWSRLDAATALFFGSLLVVGFVFIEETYTSAHYIYTMRRYEPLILPALVLGIAWSCQFLWARVAVGAVGAHGISLRSIAPLRVLGVVAALGLGVFFVYTDRLIVSHVEERGAVSQLSQLAARFKPAGKSVVLFSNDRDEPNVVATPLQYIYGIESFVLVRSYPDLSNTALERIVKRWQSQGYKVWVMMGANGGKLDLPNFSLKEQGTWKYDVPELEQLYYQKPSNVFEAVLPWGIYSIEPKSSAAQSALPFSIDVGDMDYKWLVAGFYKQEHAQGDQSDWRWTGDHAILRVPWPTQPGGKTLQGGKVTVRLRPESPTAGGRIVRTTPLTVTLSLEDTPIGTVVVPPGSQFGDYTVVVPPGVKKTSRGTDTSLLHIKAPTWSPQDAGISYDARALGIQLDSVTISK